VNRAKPDTHWVSRHCNSYRTDEKRRATVFVGKTDANMVSPNREPHALAHCLVFDLEKRFVWIGAC